MVKRRNPKEQSDRKRGCHRVNETSGDASASLRSATTVSLSDVDLSELRDDATSRPRRPTVVSLVDLESSSTTTENDTSDGDGCDSGPEANEGKRSPRATQTEEAFQQQLSVLKCRYKAELEKIEDEVLHGAVDALNNAAILFLSDRRSRKLLLWDAEDPCGVYSKGARSIPGIASRPLECVSLGVWRLWNVQHGSRSKQELLQAC